MTACVNKHTKRVAAVVTASLVGALSLGAAAPVAAFAEDGIATQSVSEQQAWANGSITYAHDNQGYIIEDPSNIEFTLDGSAHYPKVLEVTPEFATAPVRVSQANVKYYSGSTEVDPESITGAGTYKMVISAPVSSEYRGGVLEVTFKIVSKSLVGTQIFDNENGDVADTTFTYTGEHQKIGFMLDGFKVSAGTSASPFDVVYYYAGTSTKVADADGNNTPIDAGNYVAVLTGKGDYAGSEIQIPFTVNKLDLSTAEISISDRKWTSSEVPLPNSAKVNGVAMTNGAGGVKISWVGAENGDIVIKNKTTYTVSVSPADNNKNLTGSKNVTFSLVDSIVLDGEIKYGGVALDGQEKTVHVDDVKSYFDLDDITARFGKMSIVITNAAGDEVNEQTVNSVPGNYTVSVRVDAKANDYEWGSDTVTMTVKTRSGKVDADATAAFLYKGTVVDHIEPIEYTGANILDDIDTVVKYGDATLTAGTDYQVVVKDQNGSVVDSIVDAGVYHVIITSGLYDIQGDSELTVIVTPKVLNKVYMGSEQEKTFGTAKFIPYSGQAATYYFYTLDSKGNEVRIPDGVIEVDHFYFTAEGESKAVDTDEIVEQGTYKASIKVAAGVENYVFLGEKTENTLIVDDKGVFSDVDSSYWAAENIYKALELQYMSGYNGTTFFGPLDNIKRGDVAQVLYSMAGKPEFSNEGQTGKIYITGFDDVDAIPSKYYNKAIAWAKALGIISGDTGTNNFRPEDTVSRQELAKMLCVYAEKTGKDTDVDTDAVLSAYDDADTVADWARDYVAWAVDADLMGQNSPLRGTDPINRAEVATMAIRLQPKKLEDSSNLVPRP